MKKIVLGVVVSLALFSCSGEGSFCGCIEETPKDQLEYTGSCAYINDMSADEFQEELSKCMLEGFELLIR
jgi:hypothetical protein